MQITKQVDLGKGLVYTIGPLDFDQVAILQESVPSDPKDRKAWTERAWQQIEMGVQNVDPSITRDAIKGKLNETFPGFQAFQAFYDLQAAVLELSGFEVQQKTGEAIAAAENA